MYDFIQARNYTKAEGRDVKLIVIHTMENPEKPGTAHAVAKWFASSLAPQASAHYCVDSLAIVQCAQEHDVAWGAPNANRSGIHIEHAGYAAQDASGWQDAYSASMLKLSAKLAAEIAFRYAIPLVHLSPDEIKAGKSGICGHVDVTHAYGTKGGHTDPGAAWPWDAYIAAVQAAASKLQGEEFPLGP